MKPSLISFVVENPSIEPILFNPIKPPLVIPFSLLATVESFAPLGRSLAATSYSIVLSSLVEPNISPVFASPVLKYIE